MNLNAEFLKFLKQAHTRGLLNDKEAATFLLTTLDQCFSAYLGVLREVEVLKQSDKPKAVRTGKAHFKPKDAVVAAPAN